MLHSCSKNLYLYINCCCQDTPNTKASAHRREGLLIIWMFVHQTRMSNMSNTTQWGLPQIEDIGASWDPWKDDGMMINTTTNETTLRNTAMVLKMCGNSTLDQCYTTGIVPKNIVIGLNVLSVLVNVFHILLVRRVSELQGSTYLFVLQLISVADIYSATNLLSILCRLHKALLGRNIYYTSVVGLIKSHGGLIRFDTLAVASLERYLSICYPIFGTLRWDRICNRLTLVKIIASIFWTTSFILSLIENFVFNIDMCLLPFNGPSTSSTLTRILSTSYITVLTVVMLTCHISIIIRLRRTGVTREDKNKNSSRAASYIMIINSMYYLCLVPGVIIMILQPLGYAISSHAKWVIYALYSCYGILNVVAYGLRMKSYRVVVCEIFSGWRKKAPQSKQNKISEELTNNTEIRMQSKQKKNSEGPASNMDTKM